MRGWRGWGSGRGHMVGGSPPQKGAWGPRPFTLGLCVGTEQPPHPLSLFTEKEVIGFAIAPCVQRGYLFSPAASDPQHQREPGQGQGRWAGQLGSLVPWVKDWHGVRGLRGAGLVHSHCWLG